MSRIVALVAYALLLSGCSVISTTASVGAAAVSVAGTAVNVGIGVGSAAVSAVGTVAGAAF
jgi:hypothetical protein